MQKRKLKLDKELLTIDRNAMSLDGGSNYLACTMGCTLHGCPLPTQTCGAGYGCNTADCVGSEGCTYPSVENVPGTCNDTV
jgi:hypothetical protein